MTRRISLAPAARPPLRRTWMTSDKLTDFENALKRIAFNDRNDKDQKVLTNQARKDLARRVLTKHGIAWTRAGQRANEMLSA